MPGELVSIVLPTFNRADLIGETIQSVIDQSYPEWELIIIDDGSSDDTKERIALFSDERIQYHFIEHTGILGKVRNTGMRLAKGNYIAFLDSDDIWLPHKLVFQLSLLKKHPRASFIFGHGVQFGDGAIGPPLLEELFIGSVFLAILLQERFVFYVPTILFKKQILDKESAIDENLKSGGDIDFFLRMAHHFEGIFSNEIIVRIRKHQYSHSRDLELTAHHEYLEMINRFLRNGFLTKRQYKQIASKQHYKLGLLYLKTKNASAANKEFLQYLKLDLFGLKGWCRLMQSILSRFFF